MVPRVGLSEPHVKLCQDSFGLERKEVGELAGEVVLCDIIAVLVVVSQGSCTKGRC